MILQYEVDRSYHQWLRQGGKTKRRETTDSPYRRLLSLE